MHEHNVICAGELPGVPTAAFTGLPSEKILTLNMNVPEAWLVEPVKAELDLDNLRLADLGGKRRMTAEFELESLILSGSCTDVAATSRAQVSCCEVFLLVCHSTGKMSSGDTSHATPVGNASCELSNRSFLLCPLWMHRVLQMHLQWDLAPPDGRCLCAVYPEGSAAGVGDRAGANPGGHNSHVQSRLLPAQGAAGGVPAAAGAGAQPGAVCCR